jgi:hypothetical protein
VEIFRKFRKLEQEIQKKVKLEDAREMLLDNLLIAQIAKCKKLRLEQILEL